MLTEEPLTLGNLPRLADVDSFGHLLNQLGVSTSRGRAKGHIGRVMTLTADEIVSTVAPYDMVRKMRASILVLGPMLARMGEATVSLPGGCAIGNRPIDLHLKALRRWARRSSWRRAMSAPSRPRAAFPAAVFSFPVVSVGATENALMAAVLATGKTRCKRGARARNRRPVQSAGRDGRGDRGHRHATPDHPRRRPAARRDLSVMPDRIEAGSYACAAAITGGSLKLSAAADEMEATVQRLRDAGVRSSHRSGIHVPPTALASRDAVDRAFPGFADRHAGAVHGDAVPAEGAAC